jgi:hypothetical protein
VTDESSLKKRLPAFPAIIFLFRAFVEKRN